jgi:membrane protease subunit HflC
MYITANDEDNLATQLKPNFASALRNELARRPFSAMLSLERGQFMTNIRDALDRVARQYGAEVVDVRIKRADLPTGAPLDSAYQRMRTAREQQARNIEAQGNRQAQVIRAEAEAQAAATFAHAYNQDPAFYDFYRAMQSYRISFVAATPQGDSPRGRTNIILSPGNDYLRQFRGQPH